MSINTAGSSIHDAQNEEKEEEEKKKDQRKIENKIEIHETCVCV